MTTAAIYVRVSTTRQAESDLSLPDQVAQCRAFCDQRGWAVADIFSEPGASALDEDRPVFQEMIYKATRPDRPYDYVVVHSLSRFSRDALHSELYVRNLRKAGVELVSITQDIGNDPSGEFFRKMLNVFDEHQSRENAKHVHRAMLENARQGFWNGSRPPFGYAVEVTERRGSRDKKVLVIEPSEAVTVRLMFDLAAGASGRPMGVKAIATHLNERGYSRRGRRFSTGGVHDMLTSTTYCGRHYFNRRDSRAGTNRPPSQWIEIAVPAIIDQGTFNAVQGLLQSRNPKRMAPRVANGPTLLAGVARCAYCNSALIQNTGKGGTYRYYCCSRKLKEGALSCEGIRIRMDKLDDLVIGELAERILKPDRLHDLLSKYLLEDAQRADHVRDQLARLRAEHREAESALTRLLQVVEKGLMSVEDPNLRERLVALQLRRDALASEISATHKRLSSAQPTITKEKIERLGSLLRECLYGGSPELRQAYAQLLLNEVAVSREEIRLTGSKAALAKVTEKGPDAAAPQVLSYVQEWRTRQDSNL